VALDKAAIRGRGKYALAHSGKFTQHSPQINTHMKNYITRELPALLLLGATIGAIFALGF
jgi:hypothetical protein